MHFALAFAVLAATWIMLRHQALTGAGAGRRPPSWTLLPLDVAPILLGWLLFHSLLHRPILSASLIAAAALGLTVADVVKRATLREPLVFADRSELLEVVRHPRLYIPFAGPVRFISGAVLALVTLAALIWLEPATAYPSPVAPVLLTAAALFLPSWPRLLHGIAARYRVLGPTTDPAADMRHFGFLACLIMHATLARAERASRRAAIPPFEARLPPPSGPVVMLQIESFFDARRLGAAIPADLLPGLDRLQREATQTGLLDVPCWGANTVRTEFAALTGISAHSLGLDRFNPYERFAQTRLRSIAWQMKQAGYRTICVHPFDKGFYARNRVMPHLGFDEFRGPAAFAGAPMAGPYVADEAVAREIIRLLDAGGPPAFIFAITMGNHGPWDDPGPGCQTHPPLDNWPHALDALPESGPLRRFLAGLQGSDRMLALLTKALPADGTLAVYGDHQPSLPAAFAALGFTDTRTDYAVWRPSISGSTASRRNCCDIRAENLPDLLQHVLARQFATEPMDAGRLGLS